MSTYKSTLIGQHLLTSSVKIIDLYPGGSRDELSTMLSPAEKKSLQRKS